MADEQKKLRLGILLSGGGRTMVNIAECLVRSELNAEIATVISSRGNVAGVERARQIDCEPAVIRVKDNPDVKQFSKKIAQTLDAADVELVCQCGWLCYWQIPDRYRYKVMNVHPALLPSFGGQGMWGHHVHEAVLAKGCKITGCTIHFVTNEYDAGPIIGQRSCPVLQGDSPDTLAARVFEQECIAYPQAISLFAAGKLTVKDNIVQIAE